MERLVSCASESHCSVAAGLPDESTYLPSQVASLGDVPETYIVNDVEGFAVGLLPSLLVRTRVEVETEARVGAVGCAAYV